jgi:hypothetical protein
MYRRIIENCLAIGHAAERKPNFKPGFDAIALTHASISTEYL